MKECKLFHISQRVILERAVSHVVVERGVGKSLEFEGQVGPIRGKLCPQDKGRLHGVHSKKVGRECYIQKCVDH